MLKWNLPPWCYSKSVGENCVALMFFPRTHYFMGINLDEGEKILNEEIILTVSKVFLPKCLAMQPFLRDRCLNNRSYLFMDIGPISNLM